MEFIPDENQMSKESRALVAYGPADYLVTGNRNYSYLELIRRVIRPDDRDGIAMPNNASSGLSAAVHTRDKNELGR